MIKPQVVFITGHYNKPAQAPSTERPALALINLWVDRLTKFDKNAKAPCIPVEGRHKASEEEYQRLIDMMKLTDFPTPAVVSLNDNCQMWSEDLRGLPNSLNQARAILHCVNLAKRSRLPV